jgi:hypothetical protein
LHELSVTKVGRRARLRGTAEVVVPFGAPLPKSPLPAKGHSGLTEHQTKSLGPADLAEQSLTFFWSKVEPYIGHAVSYLELTMEGRQWVAQLCSNVFALEHHRQHMGPQLGSWVG